MRIILLLLALISAGMARAEGERAGVFDYYVLSLNWSPGWCAAEGAGRGSPQCDRGAGFGWVLHGLWPQYRDGGYPSYCRTSARDPGRAQTAAMADIMGTPGAAWYQWKKHGRCSGLGAPAYLAASRHAHASVVIPEAFRRLRRDIELPASVVEAAFLAANPGLTPAGITITCRDGRIAEARICLTRALEFRDCGPGVTRDCTARDALMEGIR